MTTYIQFLLYFKHFIFFSGLYNLFWLFEGDIIIIIFIF